MPTASMQHLRVAVIGAGWAGCAAAYFLIVLLFLPETRGRTLEQIEAEF